jgi:hypothetical protein
MKVADLAVVCEISIHLAQPNEIAIRPSQMSRRCITIKLNLGAPFTARIGALWASCIIPVRLKAIAVRPDVVG